MGTEGHPVGSRGVLSLGRSQGGGKRLPSALKLTLINRTDDQNISIGPFGPDYASVTFIAGLFATPTELDSFGWSFKAPCDWCQWRTGGFATQGLAEIVTGFSRYFVPLTLFPMPIAFVPAPIVGAGLPGLAMLLGLLGLRHWRRRQKIA